MTGPLAQQFEDVRAALDTLHYYGAAERHSDDDCPVCGSCDEGYAALSAIERHTQNMEKALRMAGGLIQFEGRSGAALDLINEALAAVPAREKGTECPAGHGSQCCGYPDECREALKEAH